MSVHYCFTLSSRLIVQSESKEEDFDIYDLVMITRHITQISLDWFDIYCKSLVKLDE